MDNITIPIETAIQAFLKQYALRHRPLSLTAKTMILSAFVEYSTNIPLTYIQEITPQHLQSYLLSRSKLAQKSIKATLNHNSLHTHLSALRVFFHWCYQQNWLTHNPASLVHAPKKPQHLPKAIEAERLQILFSKIPDNALEIRDLAMLELFYSSGLRLHELSQLNIEHIQLTEQEVRVINGKGGKDRLVPLGRSATQAIQTWLALRNTWQNTDSHALFLSRTGNRLTDRQIANRLQRWAKHSGSGIHLHPHLLRHSMATHILQSSQDIRAVQELLGHANINSTQIYTHLDFQSLTNAYDKAHPRATIKRDKLNNPPQEKED